MPKYKVTCLVTREEFYEIDAPDIATATTNAFGMGTFIDSGETTSVQEINVEKVKL